MMRNQNLLVMKFTELIAIGLLLLMMIQIVLDVLFRAVFGGGLPGTMTYVSNYYMLGISFIPLGLVHMRSEHITVDILQGIIKGKLKSLLNFIVLVISASTVAVMCVASFSEAVDRFTSGTSIIQGVDRIIIWPSYFLYSFGLLFFLLSIGIKCISDKNS